MCAVRLVSQQFSQRKDACRSLRNLDHNKWLCLHGTATYVHPVCRVALPVVPEATTVISGFCESHLPLTNAAPKCPHLSFQIKYAAGAGFQIPICPLFTMTVLLNIFPDIYNLHMAECD